MGYRFAQLQDPSNNNNWEVFSNFPTNMIKAAHTTNRQKIYIIDVYNKQSYKRNRDELDVMADMHAAYLAEESKVLKTTANGAATKFPGLKDAAQIYREAADRM